jgi:hypothetical protein
MSTLKAVPLVCFALMIDGFTFLIGLALSVVAAAPGTVAGCAVGAQVAGKAGCIALGLLGSIPWVNGALAVVTEPIGIMLGVAIGLCINFTLGSMLILFLVLFGMFDGKTVIGALIGEAIPGINMLPLWTGMTIRCAMKTAQRENPASLIGVASALSGGLSLSTAAKLAPAVAEAAGQRQRGDAALAPAPFVEKEEQDAARARQEAASEAKVNLKASVDRLKAGISGDITPKQLPRYGAEFSA